MTLIAHNQAHDTLTSTHKRTQAHNTHTHCLWPHIHTHTHMHRRSHNCTHTHKELAPISQQRDEHFFSPGHFTCPLLIAPAQSHTFSLSLPHTHTHTQAHTQRHRQNFPTECKDAQVCTHTHARTRARVQQAEW